MSITRPSRSLALSLAAASLSLFAAGPVQAQTTGTDPCPPGMHCSTGNTSRTGTTSPSTSTASTSASTATSAADVAVQALMALLGLS